MDEETKDHKLRLLAIYQGNLQELELQAARFGQNPPLNIINEIKFHQNNIEELRVQLQTAEEEVTLDNLLGGIEDLQKVVREEGTRAVQEFNRAFGDQVELGLAYGSIPFSGFTSVLTVGIDYLYRKYVKGTSFVDRYNLVSAAIHITGMSLHVYFTSKFMKSIVKSKHDEFIRRMGYDPFERKNK